MERELKKAAGLVKATKEKISFGIVKVSSHDDLSLTL